MTAAFPSGSNTFVKDHQAMGYGHTLRADGTWTTKVNLSSRLIGDRFGLTGREKLTDFTEDRFRLNPWFVEGMMGYPLGWTDIESKA